MANFTAFRDMHTEKKGGKYSSKKIWGTIILSLICVTYLLDGFSFFTVNASLFDPMLFVAGGLIGLHTISQIFSRPSKEEEPVKKDDEIPIN